MVTILKRLIVTVITVILVTGLQPHVQSKTKLEVALVAQPDKDPPFALVKDITAPERIDLRWSTLETNIKAGRWVLKDESGKATYASGTVQAPKGSNPLEFSIDLKGKIPPLPKRVTRVFKIVIHPVNNNLQDLDPSPPVTIKVVPPSGNDTKFGGDAFSGIGGPESYLLTAAYNDLRYKLKLSEPSGKIQTGSGNVKVLLRFEGTNGFGSMEVDSSNRIWACVPVVKSKGSPAYQWFEYKEDAKGKFVPAETDPRFMDAPPDSAPSGLGGTSKWAHGERYNVEALSPDRDVDPPHWVAILDRDSPAKIRDVHRLMQSGATRGQAQNLLIASRPLESVVLTDRAKRSWQSVTLKGLIWKSGFPGGDLARDHSDGYIVGGDIRNGWLFEGEWEDPSKHPGIDWDMYVIPDKAYAYLAGQLSNDEDHPGSMGVEISHFALKPWKQEDWPQGGEWLQTIGRWVIDTGHGEALPGENVVSFYTEIHPPELMVASGSASGVAAEARVMVTGAWLGRRLAFVVNPPPRPKPNSVLRYGIFRVDGKPGYDRKVNANLAISPYPASSPNHLRCEVTLVGKPEGQLVAAWGQVGLTRHRGMECVVKCWWDTAADPSTVSGTVRAGGKPAPGSYVFYRPAEPENARWKSVQAGSGGAFTISGIHGGNTWFRAAGSGLNFDSPKRVDVKAGSNTVSFDGSIATRTIPAYTANITGAWNLNTKGVTQTDEQQALATLRSAALMVTQTSASVGVRGNGLGYPETATVSAHLAAIVDTGGKLISSLGAAYAPSSFSDKPFILGHAGSGVAGAKVRAKLVVGNLQNGFYLVQELNSTTDSAGNVKFRVSAGPHVEVAFVQLEVVENPANPWLLQARRSETKLFHPGKSGADLVSSALTNYTLAPATIRIAAGRAQTKEDEPFAEMFAERKAIGELMRGVAAKITPAAAAAAATRSGRVRAVDSDDDTTRQSGDR